MSDTKKTYSKKYINGIFISEINFSNGGKLLDIGFNLASLINEVSPFLSNKGNINIKIAERKNPVEKNGKMISHYAYISYADDTIPKETPIESINDSEGDDLPF